MLRKIILAALFLPLVALAQSYPSPTFNNLTINGAFTATGKVGLSNLAAQAANTVVANVTGSSASPTAFSMPSCSSATSALQWTSGTGFSCNAGAAPLASPTFTGTPAAPTAAVGTNTTQIATTAFVANHDPCVSILDKGGDPSGTNDNSTALTNALAASVSTRQCVYFPPGKYAFTSGYSYTFANTLASVTIKGAGPDSAELLWPSSNGLTFNYDGPLDSVHIRDLSITTNSSASLGYTGVYLNQTVTSIPDPGTGAYSDISNVTFRGTGNYAVGTSWGNAVQINSVSNVNFPGLVIYGAGPTAGNGVSIGGSSTAIPVVYNFSNCIINDDAAGIIYGNNVQGVAVSQCNFTGNNQAIVSNASETGLDQLVVSNSQFNSFLSSIVTGSGIDNVQLLGNFFLIQPSTTAVTLTHAQNTTIVGNTFAPATGTMTGTQAISVGTYDHGSTTIAANTYQSLATGVALGAASQFVNVSPDNTFSGVTSNITNSGANNTVPGAGYVFANVGAGSAVSLASGTAANVTSISLPPGDWDVAGQVAYNVSSGAATLLQCGVNTVSATIGAVGSGFGVSQAGSNTTDMVSTNMSVMPTRVVVTSGTTTVYLVASATFSGTVSAFGSIRARRLPY